MKSRHLKAIDACCRGMKTLLILMIMAGSLAASPARAWYPREAQDGVLPDDGVPSLVGRHGSYRAQTGDTLIELARRAGLGYRELLRANPHLDPWLPSAGTRILLPYAFLVPSGIGPGITVNLAELRLYYVWRERNRMQVRVYPVGIGAEDWDTPVGNFEIISKIIRPAWTPPPAMRQLDPRLPNQVPAGPFNPLGEYWLGLSASGYGIHGTNRPYGVGRRISHGCLRLYPTDIRDLFARVATGSPVRIIDQPVKVGLSNGRLLLEVHGGHKDDEGKLLTETLRQVALLPWQGRLNWPVLKTAIRRQRGIPVIISMPTASRATCQTDRP
jgi:L,D-transpeptidase ErfK/SrfK